jgi:hypothetical protein
MGQQENFGHSDLCKAYLLITNSELALCLLVLIGESFELFDRLRLQDLDAEFDIALGVLVTGLQTLSVSPGMIASWLHSRIH